MAGARSGSGSERASERGSEHGDTATWRVLSLEQRIGEPDAALCARACREIGVEPVALRGFRIARKALDARWRPGTRAGAERRLRFVVHADVIVDRGFKSAALSRALRAGRVEETPSKSDARVERVHTSLSGDSRAHVAVVGAGPAGLFAAWVLARNGLAVTLVDRGRPIERRSPDLARFLRTRAPDPESNLLFGEGGAGTYSDGKLYTRVDDALEIPLLEELVASGAPEEILYDARAHLGTDRLHRILPALRARLEQAGVTFAWGTRLDRIELAPGPGSTRRVRALGLSSGEMPCDALVLAPGHSARDTWLALAGQGVPFEPRAFQVGVRIEHPQELVDVSQHGTGAEAESLGAAYYQLVCRGGDGAPAAHSFCMCPGGRIVASVNEPGYLCTNGMSNSTHSSAFANAAIVATLEPSAFGPGPFAGVEMQRELEQRAFEAGGSDYTAPAQAADDFLAGRETEKLRRSSYALGAVPARIDALLQPELREGIRRAIARFDRAIPGFASEQGILVGVETRSACPVRIPRDRTTRRAEGFSNLWPAGEGAGYAGGIMSAAIDGARCAISLLEHGIA